MWFCCNKIILDNKSNWIFSLESECIAWCGWWCMRHRIFNFGQRNRMNRNLIIDLSPDLISIWIPCAHNILFVFKTALCFDNTRIHLPLKHETTTIQLDFLIQTMFTRYVRTHMRKKTRQQLKLNLNCYSRDHW